MSVLLQRLMMRVYRRLVHLVRRKAVESQNITELSACVSLATIALRRWFRLKKEQREEFAEVVQNLCEQESIGCATWIQMFKRGLWVDKDTALAEEIRNNVCESRPSLTMCKKR